MLCERVCYQCLEDGQPLELVNRLEGKQMNDRLSLLLVLVWICFYLRESDRESETVDRQTDTEKETERERQSVPDVTVLIFFHIRENLSMLIFLSIVLSF